MVRIVKNRYLFVLPAKAGIDAKALSPFGPRFGDQKKTDGLQKNIIDELIASDKTKKGAGPATRPFLPVKQLPSDN